MANTNVSLGGSQDFGFYRDQVQAGMVPSLSSLDAAGFFAEHHIKLPEPACGERICLQPMVAVMGNLMNGANCTMLHLGLNSPIAADPGERPDLSLAVVVDVSGSMQGEKMEFVRQGLEMLIDGMRDDDRLTLITYSDGALIAAPLADVAGHRVELRDTIRALQADGATNLSQGLETGYRELFSEYDSGRQNRVILLSDGMPTVGDTSTASILAMSKGYNSDGIGLTTVGLGLDFNVELMRNLAMQADGNFYFLEDAGAVDEVFDEELSFFTVPVAFDLEVSLAAGDDYAFGRALGSPFWSDTARGGSLEVPSVFLAHRDSDEDVTEDDGRRGGGSSLLVELMPLGSSGDEGGANIAQVDVAFREPGSSRLIVDRVNITYPYAPGELRPEGHFQADDIGAAQKSFIMLNIYAGLEVVSMEFESGVADEETVSRLDNLIGAVEDYNDEVADKDIELDLVLLVQLRANLVQSGVRAEPPAPMINPWPAD
jgi:Ca-activated chloride channel family protein